MKWTQFLLPTLKEVPAEAEAVSHVLMLRAGLIRKLTAGVYSYLPLGVRVLRKVEAIVREEMNAQGALEVLLPAIHPVELWKRSGRFEVLGEDMITFNDRHKKLNILGPTHEEVITDLVAHEVNSYRQLPLILYQIQTKFRDEARPRFGVMRSREFIMKDAYSFDANPQGLDRSYEKMYNAYCAIFARCGLEYIPVEADTGVMGGNASHEFMVLAQSGEDRIVCCTACRYAASIDKAECREPEARSDTQPVEPLREVHTPGIRSGDDVAAFLKCRPMDLIKTLIYMVGDTPVAVLVRADHEVNEAKLGHAFAGRHLSLADEATIRRATGGPRGFSGPVGLRGIEIVADAGLRAAGLMGAGANKADTHLVGVDMDRDVTVSRWLDIRTITERDACPRCQGRIELRQAIEVGHVFKLGTKYSEALKAGVVDESGVSRPIIMGCYGIGVTRIIAACIEQRHDEQGIVWPRGISPFSVVILLLNLDHEPSRTTAADLYALLSERLAGDVLLDDRNVRAGIKFKDADLIGIPLQIIVGEKNIVIGKMEIKTRATQERQLVDIATVPDVVAELLARCP